MKIKKKSRNNSFFSNKTSYREEHDESTRSQSFENTNDILFNQQKEFILNKKIVKISKNPKAVKIQKKALNFRPQAFDDEYNDVNMDKWYKNRIKITYNEKNPKNVIYKLCKEEKLNSNSCLLFAGKEKGIYVIRNDEGIVAKIRWNFFF